MTFYSGLDRFAARIALVQDDQAVTYGELRRRAEAVASRLQPQSLVFLEARNTIESVAAYLGCLIGGHPVYLFNAKDRPQAEGLMGRYRPNAVIDGDGVQWLHGAPVAVHPDLRVLLGTSGSTGSPKLVKLSERNIQSNAHAIAQYLGLRGDDRAATSLKFAHSFGMSVINSHLAVGASLWLTELSVSDPEFWTLFRRHGATSFSGVPYSFEMLSRGSESWAQIPSLRHVAQAGGRLDPDLVRRFAGLGAKNGWRLFVMYGQTEASPRIAYLPPEEAGRRAGCIGTPIPGGQIRLLDEGGAPVVPGQPGQLAYSGPNVMMGYAEAPEALATDETPPALLTGDIAVEDPDGLFRIVGRTARFVKPYGVRINLDDVQAEARRSAPGAVCAGDDERIVIAAVRGEVRGLRGLGPVLAERYGLPSFVFQTVALDEIPLLANGKVDLKRVLDSVPPQGAAGAPPRPAAGSPLSILLSSAYAKQVLIEAGKILGVSPQAWNSVAAIYGVLLNRPDVSATDTFVGLSGDSLSYVQAHLALEAYLGQVPAGWETMTVEALQRMHDDEVAL